MPEYDDELSGVLFVNDRKTQDKQPDYTGNCQIGGVKFWLSGWKRQDRSGGTFLSLAFTAKDAEQKPAAKAAPAPVVADDENIPF